MGDHPFLLASLGGGGNRHRRDLHPHGLDLDYSVHDGLVARVVGVSTHGTPGGPTTNRACVIPPTIKKSKMAKSTIGSVSLGSLSLKQYENVLGSGNNSDIFAGGSGNKINAYTTSDILKRLQVVEESAARQATQLVVEERKKKELEIHKRNLEMEVKRQHELL